MSEEKLSLSCLGEAEAGFVATEIVKGRKIHRFSVAGSAFGSGASRTSRTDARDGHIVPAAFGLNNLCGYWDFLLTQTGELHGAKAWVNIQRQHFGGCAVTGS